LAWQRTAGANLLKLVTPPYQRNTSGHFNRSVLAKRALVLRPGGGSANRRLRTTNQKGRKRAPCDNFRFARDP